MGAIPHDAVNRPAHYVGDGLEAIEVIEDWQLGFHLGNAVKYILRAGKKGDRRQDLEKALWYVRRAQTQQPSGGDGQISPRRVEAAFGLPSNETAALWCIWSAAYRHDVWDELLHTAEGYLEEALSGLAAPAAQARDCGPARCAGPQHDGDPTSEHAASTRVRRES